LEKYPIDSGGMCFIFFVNSGVVHRGVVDDVCVAWLWIFFSRVKRYTYLL